MAARRLLVPVAVLALVLALVLWRSEGDDPRHDFGDDVQACKANLRFLYQELALRTARTGRPPAHSGAAFFLELLASGDVPDTPENRARFSCPGRHAQPVRAGLDPRELAAPPADASAYAGRDTAAFPLARFPAGGDEREPLIACDNARGLNHAGVMNVLYSDGSVETLVLEQEIGRGRLPAGALTIPVGNDSPLPELRKLVAD
jgi:prepilin-type processing-associated H-X9-DG protein